MSAVIHHAGEVDAAGKVQKCDWCGIILTDYREAERIFGSEPGFWEPGVEVVALSGGVKYVRNEAEKTEYAKPCNQPILH